MPRTRKLGHLPSVRENERWVNGYSEGEKVRKSAVEKVLDNAKRFAVKMHLIWQSSHGIAGTVSHTSNLKNRYRPAEPGESV